MYVVRTQLQGSMSDAGNLKIFEMTPMMINGPVFK
jgi:hypothetical protein